MKKKTVSAESANSVRCSIPNVALVKINFVLAQQSAVFLLKRASAVVFLLARYVLHDRIKLARAHRKRAVPALPEETAKATIKCFDPLRRGLLYFLDPFGLRKSSRQRGHDVDVVSHTADVRKFGALIPADCRQICMHARTHL